MDAPGARRAQLDATLRAAYGQGLLSDRTFAYRVDRLLTSVTIDPSQLIGDLTLSPGVGLRDVPARMRAQLAVWRDRREAGLLALDWTRPASERLIVGRGTSADVRREDPTVSRLHAELLWRGGGWVLHDLGSRNGTMVNGRPVSRAQIRPGDLVRFAQRTLRVD